MHSEELIRHPCPPKTREEYEAEWGLTGLVEHLRRLGWTQRQWNYEEDPAKGRPHFAEFFSPLFHGYLRGESHTSVREAVERCLNQAQRFAACERSEGGHDYASYRGYTNGFVVCKKCGFNGYTSHVEALQRQIDRLEWEWNKLKRREMRLAEALKELGYELGHDDELAQLDH